MELKVLTLNVWGLHFLAERVRERLGYIAREIRNYDIVALQEVWSRDDHKFLMGKLEDVLPHSFHLHSSIIGTGLCFFSRYPLMSSYGHAFSVTGGTSKKERFDGEMLAGKGVLSVRVMTPSGPVLVVNTHINPRCRESQIFEIAQLVMRTRGSDPVIVCGDFNTKDTHVAYSLMTRYLGLKDAFVNTKIDTCDLVENIFTSKKSSPKRIDFVFYSDEWCPSVAMEIQCKQLALTGPIPGKDFPYSDHEGVEVVFQLKEKKNHTLESYKEKSLGDDVVGILEEVCSNIEARKATYVTSHRQVVTNWTLLAAVSFLALIILSNSLVMDTLRGWYLGWVAVVGMGLVGAGSVFRSFAVLFHVQHMNAMQSIVDAIQLQLKYNRIQRDSCNRFDS